LAVYLGRYRFDLVLIALGAALALVCNGKNTTTLVLPLLLFIFAAISYIDGFDNVALWYPVLINLVLCSVFAASLFSEATIVERFARRMEQVLLTSEQLTHRARYCRAVTIAWCIFFLCNAGVAAFFVLANMRFAWMLYASCISYILIGTGMLVEYYARMHFKRRIGLIAFVGALSLVSSPILHAEDDLLTALMESGRIEESIQKKVVQKRYVEGLTKPRETEGVMWLRRNPVVGVEQSAWSFGWLTRGEGGVDIKRRSDDAFASEQSSIDQHIGSILAAFVSSDREQLLSMFSVRKQAGLSGEEIVFTPKAFRMRRVIKAIRLNAMPNPSEIVVMFGPNERLEIALSGCDTTCAQNVQQHQTSPPK
jgi:uncharacterized membrane protein